MTSADDAEFTTTPTTIEVDSPAVCTSPGRDGDSLNCSTVVAGGPFENDPSDRERSLADLPALADRLAARHRKEACQRRGGRGPRPQPRRVRPVPQVA